MVSVRENLVDCFGLKVRIETDKGRNKTLEEKYIPDFAEGEFYLTEESSAFKLVVENPEDKKREGVVVLTWHLGNNISFFL